VGHAPRHRFAHGRITGFGTKDFLVEEIPPAIAIGVIRAGHYSGTHVNNSRLHLGVFAGSPRRWLVGCLQFGPVLNPGTQTKVVANTADDEYLELNRMWLSPEAPHGSESRAVSYALKTIKGARPRVKWVQSFADGRCGVGTVYQAANFLCLGAHTATFYELDGVWYHEIAMSNTKRPGVRGAHLQANRHRARKHHIRQYRYITFLRRGARKHLKMRPRAYPKPDTAPGRPG